MKLCKPDNLIISAPNCIARLCIHKTMACDAQSLQCQPSECGCFLQPLFFQDQGGLDFRREWAFVCRSANRLPSILNRVCTSWKVDEVSDCLSFLHRLRNMATVVTSTTTGRQYSDNQMLDLRARQRTSAGYGLLCHARVCGSS